MFLKQAAHKVFRLFSHDEELEILKARLELLEKQPRESKDDPSQEPTKLDPDKRAKSKTSVGMQALAIIATTTGAFIAGLGGYFVVRMSKRQNNAAMYPALMQIADLAKQVLAQKMALEKSKTKSNVVPLHNRGPGKLDDTFFEGPDQPKVASPSDPAPSVPDPDPRRA